MAALILGVTLLLGLVMAVAWLVQRWLDNAGWVDVVWTFGLGLAGIIYALAPEPGIAWPGTRQILLALLAGGWALRLGLHLFGRTGKLPEDVRYAELRRQWGRQYQAKLFGFLQIQAAASALLALSVLAAAKALPMRSCSASAPIRPIAARSAKPGCGGSRAIRIIFSNGWAGSPIRCWRSAPISAAASPGSRWSDPC
jgi:steroid 5-alpha reductase family enzyme